MSIGIHSHVIKPTLQVAKAAGRAISMRIIGISANHWNDLKLQMFGLHWYGPEKNSIIGTLLRRVSDGGEISVENFVSQDGSGGKSSRLGLAFQELLDDAAIVMSADGTRIRPSGFLVARLLRHIVGVAELENLLRRATPEPPVLSAANGAPTGPKHTGEKLWLT